MKTLKSKTAPMSATSDQAILHLVRIVGSFNR